MRFQNRVLRVVALASVLAFLSGCQKVAENEVGGINDSFTLQKLQVEYQEEALGLDEHRPRFSWRMSAPVAKRGYYQTAYQITVRDEQDTVVWDSGKVDSGKSVAIAYDGESLQPTTRYVWSVLVWNQGGDTAEQDSWFETGLHGTDSELSGWDGATWIGGGPDSLVLQSQYLPVFKLKYTIELDKSSDSTRASFIVGANDARLMDKEKNIYGIQSGLGESYLRLELDVSEVSNSPDGLASLNIYRAGYHPEDQQENPIFSVDIPASALDLSNMYGRHEFVVYCNIARFSIYLGGESESTLLAKDVVVNPVGPSQDYIAFPMVADIGFSVPPDQKAYFTNVEIRNYREPSSVLFQEDLGKSNYTGIFSGPGFSVSGARYVIEGGPDGSFITADPSRNAMPMLRHVFPLADGEIARARLYVTARGIYEVYINGDRVGSDYFNPGLSQYNKTHFYQSYDVTSLLRRGEKNVIGAMLGEGWWSGAITFIPSLWNFFGDRQAFLAKLVVTFADGSSKIVITDPDTWRFYDDGPVRYGSLFQGEVYDSTREAAVENWGSAQYDDGEWVHAVEVPQQGIADFVSTFPWAGDPVTFDFEGFQLRGQIGNNAGVVDTLVAKSVIEVHPGVFVYDMGQNMVGVPQIKISGGRSGQKITMRFAEVRYPESPVSGDKAGMIMLENIRAALAQDIHVLKGGDETIQPRFTFHGYRFVEITGLESPLPVGAVKGLVISSIPALSSHYESSNHLVNQLWDNITWSLRGNFLSIPTDTPARNERMGWGGDINAFSPTAAYLADVGPFLRRHLRAMRDTQDKNGRFPDVSPIAGGFGGILWGSAGVTIPWHMYRQYGDVEVLREHYAAMKSYIEYLETRIGKSTGVMEEGPLGDWLSPEGSANDDSQLWTAYYIHDLDIVSKVAVILGRTKDAGHFHQLLEKNRSVFVDTYLDHATGMTVRSSYKPMMFGPWGPDTSKMVEGQPVDTQASYAVPLALDVLDGETATRVAARLADRVSTESVDDKGVTRPPYSLMTGFIGTAAISDALSKHGYHEQAYRMLQNQSYPSWLYPVRNGATTIWERLDSYTSENDFGDNNSMNSFNHYSFGAVGAWLYQYSLGISQDLKEPAFKHFVLQPKPDPSGEMTWARGYYDSVYGRIKSQWSVEPEGMKYGFGVPANTSATLYLEADSVEAVSESGTPLGEAEGVEVLGVTDDMIKISLLSGDYEFVVHRQQ